MAFVPQFPGHIETCWFCNAEWGHCTCHFPSSPVEDPSATGFDFEGIFITDPRVSVCTRFFVNPVQYYGEQFIDSELSRRRR